MKNRLIRVAFIIASIFVLTFLSANAYAANINISSSAAQNPSIHEGDTGDYMLYLSCNKTGSGSGSITGVRIDLNGTATTQGDVQKVSVYVSSDTVFGGDTLFGEDDNSGSGWKAGDAVNITGSLSLTGMTQYLLIVIDVNTGTGGKTIGCDVDDTSDITITASWGNTDGLPAVQDPVTIEYDSAADLAIPSSTAQNPSITEGDSSIFMLSFAFQKSGNGYEPYITGLSIDLNGTATTQGDVQDLTVYVSDDDVVGADTLYWYGDNGGSGWGAGDTINVTGNVLVTSTVKYMLILISVSDGTSGLTIGCDIDDTSDITTDASGWGDTSGLPATQSPITIQEAIPASLVIASSTAWDPSITEGDSDVYMVSISFESTGTGVEPVITDIDVDLTGTADTAGNIRSVEIYVSDDSIVGNDTLFGASFGIWKAGDTVTVSGFTTVPVVTQYFLVLLDIDLGTAGKTIGVSVNDTTDFVTDAVSWSSTAGLPATQTPITIAPINTDGDGYILRRSDDDMCQACHDMKDHNRETTASSYTWSIRTTCVTCHDPHKTRNIFLVSEVVNGKTVDFRVMNGSVPGDKDRANGDSVYDGICEVCHTQTKYHRNNPTGDHSHYVRYGVKGCEDCHPHKQGFTALGCLGCHCEVTDAGDGAPTRRITCGPTGDFVKTSHHVTDGTTTELAEDHDCMVCHYESIDVSKHKNNRVDLRDPDTGAIISLTYGTTFHRDVTSKNLETDVLAVQGFCMKCHDSDGATATHCADGTPLQPFTANTRNAPNIFDAFSTSNAFHHAVRGAGDNPYCSPTATNGNIITMETPWNQNTDDHDKITCFDCHTSNNGHGGDNNHMLRVQITGITDVSGIDQFCLTCHKTTSYYSGDAGSKYSGHDLMNHKPPLSAYTCRSCHAGQIDDDGNALSDNGGKYPNILIHGGSFTWDAQSQTPGSETVNFLLGGYLSGLSVSPTNQCYGGSCSHASTPKSW